MVDDRSLGPGGALRNAISGYYNPRPPRPNGVDFWQYSNGRFTVNNNESNNQYTNWDQSLGQAGADRLRTSSSTSPTATRRPTTSTRPATRSPAAAGRRRSTDQQRSAAGRHHGPGDRGGQPGQEPATPGCSRSASAPALSNSASAEPADADLRPQVVRDADLANVDSLNDVDVALVTDFDDLAAFMRGVVLQLCSPSLTIQKLAQTADDAGVRTRPQGWDMTVTPTVPGGTGFRWILPNGAPATSKTRPPPTPTASPSSSGSRSSGSGLRGHRGGGARDPATRRADPDATTTSSASSGTSDGNVRTVSGRASPTPERPSFDLDPIGQEIGTCKVYNSFDYAPGHRAHQGQHARPRCAATSTHRPTVTSTFVVTNPGNTPLGHVSASTDDNCGPVAPVPRDGSQRRRHRRRRLARPGRGRGSSVPASGSSDAGLDRPGRPEHREHR